jgi:CRISPR/Cas system CSM-associated protein Csm3 (group 7 of RAMP superfamily)
MTIKNLNNNSKITGKLILRGEVRNLTNLLVGSGNEKELGFEVLKDPEGQPYIPGSSFAGMIKAHFVQYCKIESEYDMAHRDYLWGSENTNDQETMQSHLIVDDLQLLNTASIGSRDGVSIDYTSGISNNYYNYEFVNPDARFAFKLELTLRDGVDIPLLLSYMKFIWQRADQHLYFQGAFTSHYFGLLSFENVQWMYFDFKQSLHAEHWFAFLRKQLTPQASQLLDNSEQIVLPEIKPSNELHFKAKFSIKSNLIIGSANRNVNDHVDKSHLVNYKDEPIVSSKSVRGAIRQRMRKIYQHLKPEDKIDPTQQLFGFAENKNAKKGRIQFQESIISNGNFVAQNRISICRLTGKVLTGALATEIVEQKGEFTLEFKISEPTPKEIFLLLQALKDMIHKDLPLGGNTSVGRGVLEGKSLEVRNGKPLFKWLAKPETIEYDASWKEILTQNPFSHVQ